MFNLKTFGCLVILILFGLGIFFAKFLVPVVPLILFYFAYYSVRKVRKVTLSKPQNVYELTEGMVSLEGTVVMYDEVQNISPYFGETCIGYHYKEIEYIPTEDGYNKNVLSETFACSDFTLSTNTGTIRVSGKQIILKDLTPRIHNEHSLKQNVNDISHVEYVLKRNDKIVLIGTAVKNNELRFEIAKHKNNPFFVTSRSNIEEQKISYQVLVVMFPWMCALYIAVNYFLFFAPSKVVPKNDLFAYLSIFGLPVMFVVFLLIGKNKNDWFSQVFQYLAGVCIITSLLSFPLTILFYMIKLEPYRMHNVFYSIISITALAMLFNYNKLMEYNSQSEKLKNTKSADSDF